MYSFESHLEAIKEAESEHRAAILSLAMAEEELEEGELDRRVEDIQARFRERYNEISAKHMAERN